MPENINEELCFTCANSIWCNTWCEVKCVQNKKRYNPGSCPVACDTYKKRNKSFIERPCQCEWCLANDKLRDEIEVDK